jgi:hypothetical protein
MVLKFFNPQQSCFPFFLPPYSKHCFEKGLLHVHVREEYTYLPYSPPYSKHRFEHGLLHAHVHEEYIYVPNSDFNLYARVHSQVPRIRIRIRILSNTNIKRMSWIQISIRIYSIQQIYKSI